MNCCSLATIVRGLQRRMWLAKAIDAKCEQSTKRMSSQKRLPTIGKTWLSSKLFIARSKFPITEYSKQACKRCRKQARKQTNKQASKQASRQASRQASKKCYFLTQIKLLVAIRLMRAWALRPVPSRFQMKTCLENLAYISEMNGLICNFADCLGTDMFWYPQMYKTIKRLKQPLCHKNNEMMGE